MNKLQTAAQRLLTAIDNALPHAPLRGEFDVVADTADDLKAALAEPVQGPVAWMTVTPSGDEDDIWYENPEGELLEGWTYKPLYTAPPQRKPLSEEEAKAIAWVGPVYAPDGVVTRTPTAYRQELERTRMDAIRRTEAAHGIKE